MNSQQQKNTPIMPRLMLTDNQWINLQKRLLKTKRVYNKTEHRMTIEGILFRMRTGCPWRDIPKEFGRWNTVFRRFHLWSKKEILLQLFNDMNELSDTKLLFVDGSIVRAHQHAMGARGHQDKAINRSCGGNSTKIHLAVDSYGLPNRFFLTGGAEHESKIPIDFINDLPDSKYIIADKRYDSEALRNKIRDKNAKPVIPRKKNSKTENADIDWALYRYRHLVENAFARLKHFRTIATRYDKLFRNYASTLALACCYILLPLWVD